MHTDAAKAGWLQRVAGWWSSMSVGWDGASDNDAADGEPAAQRDGVDAGLAARDGVANLAANGGDTRPMLYFVDNLTADETTV